jgi:hypothetical protein
MPDDSGTMEPPTVTQTFSDDGMDVMSAERGFADQVDFASNGDFSYVKKNGRTLAYAGVRLDDYRFKDLDAAILTTIDSGLSRARTAGIELVLRFVYNNGPGSVSGAPDASLTQMLSHVTALAPKLQANADVVFVLQAGFIGYWGEWHHSGGTDPNNLDNDAAHKTLLQALLAALPKERMLEIRAPMYKGAIYGAALTPAEAFDGSEKARIGHHNDCFLSSPDDYGTYATPMWKDYVATETLFVPHGGETCSLDPPRSDCASSLAEMEKLHTTHLNALYNPQVLGGWQTQGCMPEIQRRLGYRFVLTNATFSERVRPGGILQLAFTVHNGGFASLVNPHTVSAVIDGQRATLSIDPRKWAAGSDATYSGKLRIPATLSAGTHALALEISGDVHFANAPSIAITVDASAPGAIDPSATALQEIP